ncbi:MAG: transglycosylase domain-containing protein [Bacteroidetes bacterium]|nr:transglycosylase domain-containing protein [Bacteroidota bacterium]
MKSIRTNIVDALRHPGVRKTLKWTGISVLILTILFLAGWFLFRGQILNYAWNKAARKVQEKGYLLQCSQKGFSGVFTAEIQNLTLSLTTDTVAKARKLEAEIAIWASLWNGPTLDGLELTSMHLNLVRTPAYCNFCGLSSSERKTEKSSDPLAQRFFNLVRRSVARIPGKLLLTDFRLRYRDTADTLGLYIPNLSYRHNDLKGSITLQENDHSTGFAIQGELRRSNITGRLSLQPTTGKWAALPVLKRKFNLLAGFEKADFALEELDMRGGVLHLVADGKVTGVTVNDRRLADTNVIIRNCEGKLVAHLGKDYFEIDSATTLSLNKIKTHLYARADLGIEKKYTLKFQALRIQANDFFQSLPEGMFKNLKGLQAKGELEYNLYAHLEDAKPYDCIFQSELKPHGFAITQMGETDLRKMNGQFQHTFYERGRPVRSFVVGSGAYTPLDAIPEVLQKAVMTGEDPAFYGHNGFYQEAIRQSIAQNYVQKRFARGGSTISMQLVKNVFLSRRKTLARKAEEILLVWLIESQRLTSKARMFEVYLNIIEWGPGVFGIGEASTFYFSKPAAELNPLECAFLASIIPSPKSYRYFLDSAGYVSKRNWNFVAIRNAMIKRGDLNEADTASFDVKITGPAAAYLNEEEDEGEDEETKEELIPLDGLPIDPADLKKKVTKK